MDTQRCWWIWIWIWPAVRMAHRVHHLYGAASPAHPRFSPTRGWLLHCADAFWCLQRGKLEMEQLFREVVPEQNRYGTRVGEGRGTSVWVIGHAGAAGTNR